MLLLSGVYSLESSHDTGEVVQKSGGEGSAPVACAGAGAGDGDGADAGAVKHVITFSVTISITTRLIVAANFEGVRGGVGVIKVVEVVACWYG